MRVGTFCKIMRSSTRTSLRKFASLINMPHSTIAAIESGWLPPNPTTVFSLLDYLSIYDTPKTHSLTKYVGAIFLKEYAFRLYADNPFCPISWCSSGILKAFLDSEYSPQDSSWPESFVKQILPEQLVPEGNDPKREVDFTICSYLWSLIRNDTLKYSCLSIETKFKLIVWFAKEMHFIKPEDTRRHYLTQPPSRIKKILDSFPPVVSQVPWTFGHFRELISERLPSRIPEPFSALDIILTIGERVELNPLNPGEITVHLTSHTQKRKKVTCFYPPSVTIPEVYFSEPLLQIEEMSI